MRIDGRWLALGLVASLAGACENESGNMVTPEESEALVAMAPELTLDGLAAELGLDASQRAAFGEGLASLHDVMRDVHEQMPDGMEGMSHEEISGLHEELKERMAPAHDRIHALMETLNDEQRARFVEHVHERMAERHAAAGHPDAAAHHEAMHEAHTVPGSHESGHAGHTGGRHR